MGAKAVNSIKKTAVFLVDDHPIVREGFAQLINKQSDFRVCGQTSTAPEAFAAIPDAAPDLVVLDIAVRGVKGIELVKEMAARWQNLAILVLSAQDELLYAERAIRAGAKGYIMKHAPVLEIMSAMRKAAEGKRYLSAPMQDLLIERLAGGNENLSKPGIERLSDREMEVFQLIATGRNSREIAEHLHLSIKTIETYRANIKEKMKLRNGIDLMRAAVAMAAEHA